MATYRTSTSEVRVTFFATDQSNHLVDTVEKDDFAVVGSGFVIRDFRSLARSSETALDVVVLVDASESVASRFRTTVNDVLTTSFPKISGCRRQHFCCVVHGPAARSFVHE